MLSKLIDLTDKTIIITGASSGIGYASAIMLASVGAKCMLIARRENKLEEVIKKLNGEGHRYYRYDLFDIGEIEKLINTIVMDVGPIDGLAYCAGIPGTQPIKMNSNSYMQKIMQVNFFAYYEMIRCIVKKGNFHNPCRIVGISSVGAKYPQQGQSPYGASKAAMDTATRGLAVELASKGICLNTVLPGGILTEMHKSFLEETGIDFMNSIKDRQFLGCGQPEDVAGMVTYLLSPAAKFITGQNIIVDGGYTCH